MGTKTKHRKKTRAEKIAESRGKTPKRLRDELNKMEIRAEEKWQEA